MSLELLSKLEKKIQAALDTIELQKLELEEEKQKTIELTEKNEQLRQELNSWNDKVSGLVGLLNENEEVN
ncbi:MAG: cell division protein ZapB [Parashewanella sp.]